MTLEAAEPLELFCGSGSPYAWRAQLALEVKGLPYVAHMLSFSERQHKTPEYLALNPRGKVPTLRRGAYVLTESTAIVEYIDALSPEPPLFGRTAEERGRVAEGVAQVVSYLEPIAPRIYRPIFWGAADADIPGVNAAADELHAELGRVEARLTGAPWVAIGALSAADLTLYPVLQILLRAATRPAAAKFSLGLAPLADRYPALAAWCGRIEALPGFDRTWPPHWRGT